MVSFGPMELLILLGIIGIPILIILILRSTRKGRVASSKIESKDSREAVSPPSDAYDVFMSYRRSHGSESARLIRAELQKYSLRIFLDVDDLRAGHFDQEIVQRIATTPNYIVILSPGSLDRFEDKEDWFRQEIAQAIIRKRNIVPILMPGFKFPEKPLPDDIEELRLYQSVTYSHEFFEAMIGKIKGYLKQERLA
jgi:NAD(+) hydrolase SARM1